MGYFYDGDSFKPLSPRQIEQRKLATMTFHERKAYRVAKLAASREEDTP